MRKLVLAFIMLLSLGLAACGNGTSSAISADDELYTISQDNYSGIVAGDGTLIFEPKYFGTSILRDNFTKVPKYIQITNMKAGPERDQYGEPTNVKYSYALYDTKGKLLRDYAEDCNYTDAVGDFVAVNSSYFMNPLTGEKRYGEFSMYFMTDNTMILYFDKTKKATIVDKKLDEVKTIDNVQDIYNPAGGANCMAVCNTDGLYGLFDESGKQLLAYKYDAISGVRDGYATVTNKDIYKVINLSTGATVMETKNPLNYCDGSVAIMCKEGANYQNKYYLVDMTGKVLTDAYDNIWYNESYITDNGGATVDPNAANSNIFTAYQDISASDGNTLTKTALLNKSGQILLSHKGENSSLSYVGINRIVLGDYGGDTSSAVLMDITGKVIIPKGKYTNIYNAYSESGEQSKYLVGSYLNSQGLNLCDIIDADGNVQVASLKDFRSCDGKRIVAAKGFSKGLMDMKGKWLYETSVFNSLSNDF